MSGAAFDAAALERPAREILSRYPQPRAATIPLLHLAQEQQGCVTPEAEVWVGRMVGIAPAHVREVVTFYTRFRKQPRAACQIDVCTNMSCWLRGSDEVLRYLEERLGIKPGHMTADGRFELNEVECLCACEMAPMAQVNDDFVGPLTRESIDRLLDDHGWHAGGEGGA